MIEQIVLVVVLLVPVAFLGLSLASFGFTASMYPGIGSFLSLISLCGSLSFLFWLVGDFPRLESLVGSSVILVNLLSILSLVMSIGAFSLSWSVIQGLKEEESRFSKLNKA